MYENLILSWLNSSEKAFPISTCMEQGEDLSGWGPGAQPSASLQLVWPLSMIIKSKTARAQTLSSLWSNLAASFLIPERKAIVD